MAIIKSPKTTKVYVDYSELCDHVNYEVYENGYLYDVWFDDNYYEYCDDIGQSRNECINALIGLIAENYKIL